MKNIKLFLRAFLTVICLIVFLIIVTVSAAVVDTNTRKMTFGEGDPALAAENYKDYTKIYFFGFTFNLYDSTVEGVTKNIKNFFRNTIPVSFRTYSHILQKINSP